MANDLNTYLSSKTIFDKISDMTRIVDPVKKQVINYKDNEGVISSKPCFDFWEKNKICDNCISMRAYNDDTTYVKLEYKGEKTYMITAVPYDLPDRRVVVEILKDITNSMFLDSGVGSGTEVTGVHALIDAMNKLAFVDALTGLYNRRYILEKLPVDLVNATLSSQNVSLIMADIDHFKNVNDTYGHMAGDHTLKVVAETLSSCLKRGSDWAARFGGEEFLICMPGSDLEMASSMAEIMRQALEKQVIRYEDKEFGLTCSFGVYCTSSPETEHPEEMIKSADEKLYLAKKNGRNRVEY